MKLSIIIPSYNRKELLKIQLEHLNHQENIDRLNFEVIIVDDGSIDGTKEMVSNFNTKFEKRYTFLPRNDKSSRSRARNNGAKLASGEILTFLDSGILPSDDFVQKTVNFFGNENSMKKVILHYIYGVVAKDSSLFERSENFDQFLKMITDNSEWRDTREDVFNHLERIPAPWVLGWSGMISLHKKEFQRVNGFDETFLNWGGEDSEFSLKLHLNENQFIFKKDIFGIHLPHEKEKNTSENQKIKSSQRNRNKIFYKHPMIETELYTVFPSQILNEYLNILDTTTVHQMIIEPYPKQTKEYLKKIIRESNKSLLVGFDNTHEILDYLPTDVFFFNKNSFQNFQSKAVTKYHHFGIKTEYCDCNYETIVISDFIRTLPKHLMKMLIEELYRISDSLYIVFSDHYKSTFLQLLDGVWLSKDDVKDNLNELNLKIVLKETSDSQSIFEVSESREWFFGNTHIK